MFLWNKKKAKESVGFCQERHIEIKKDIDAIYKAVSSASFALKRFHDLTPNELQNIAISLDQMMYDVIKAQARMPWIEPNFVIESVENDQLTPSEYNKMR